MLKFLPQLKNQSGMILFTSLAILSVLLMVGIGSRVMLQNDYRVLTNLRGGTEAFYLAVAGLEWSKGEISRTTSFPPAPGDHVENFAGGSFSTVFLTPRASGPLSAEIVVRSTGTIGVATQQIQAQLIKAYDLADAALGIRGNANTVYLGGASISISGLDYDPVTGVPVASAKPRPAISAGDNLIYQMVDQAGGQLPAGGLTGGSGSGAIVTSEYLSTNAVSQLADRLCAQPNANMSAVPVSGTLGFDNQTWGSRSVPQVRCIDGLNSMNDFVTMSGVNGAGILIIRNSDLVIAGQFHWEGLIIVTGSSVGLKASGESVKDILGAVLVNETGVPDSGKAILDIQGNIRIRFSRDALNQAAGLLPTAVITEMIAWLPNTLKQNYWRVVSP